MKSAMRRSIADIWSRSARILSNGDIASVDRLQTPDLAYAEPGRIADADLRLVEEHAAVDRVELAQGRTVQVDLRDRVGLGDRDVHRRGDADAGLEHAADHALDPVHGGDVGDTD